MRLRAGFVAVFLTAGLIVTGCGGLSTAGAPVLPAASAGAGDDGPGNPEAGDGGTDTESLPSGLDVPGFNSGCLSVTLTYASIMVVLLPGALRGDGTFDPSKIDSAIDSLKGQLPAELQGDFAVVSAAAKSASGKSLSEAGQILGSAEVKAATDHISSWLQRNCHS